MGTTQQANDQSTASPSVEGFSPRLSKPKFNINMQSTQHLDNTMLSIREYIAPGGIGSQKTQVQWNKGSNTVMGTNKTSALRLDLYNNKQDITTMISVNPHESRFDNFNRLPRINSKYKNSLKLDFNKTSGRDQVLKINTRLNKES